MSTPASHTLHKKFRRRLHPHLHCPLRPQVLDDVQAHYNLLYKVGSDTGASFDTMRELLSAAFPPTQLHYHLRLVEFVNEPFHSKAKRHSAVSLTKRRLAMPPSSANLVLPPTHATRWKQWVADHQQLFPSLFLPKIRVIDAIIDHRIRSISELAASPLPEGEPGQWTNDMLGRIAQHFRSSKLVGLMYAKRGWSAFILIRRASMAPTTSLRCSSTSNPAELCLPTFVLAQSGHSIGRTTRTPGR